MTRRLLVLSACLALTAGYLARAGRAESQTARLSFAAFPIQLGEWTAQPAPGLDKAVTDALGVDEYVNRYYTAGDRAVHLYIGYYGSQRQGRTIHSPMNCMPGSGWTPLETGTLALAAGPVLAPGGRIVVNDTVIQKGLDKQVVLYWYQSHGRVESSDYWNRIYLVLDSIRLNRTDGALIRVIAPFEDRLDDPRAAAERTAIDFVNAIVPQLGRYLPT